MHFLDSYFFGFLSFWNLSGGPLYRKLLLCCAPPNSSEWLRHGEAGVTHGSCRCYASFLLSTAGLGGRSPSSETFCKGDRWGTAFRSSWALACRDPRRRRRLQPPAELLALSRLLLQIARRIYHFYLSRTELSQVCDSHHCFFFSASIWQI